MDIKNSIERIILKKFDGVISPEEQKHLDKWVKKPSNQLIYGQYEAIWSLSNSLSHWEEFDAFKALDKVKEKMPASQIKPISRRLINIAAAVILLIGLGFGAFTIFPEANLFAKSEKLESQRMFLSDGSEVVLAAGSEIETLAGFNLDERRVKLHGEAFFNITHQKDRSFIIEMDNTEIEVVGTSFLANSKENSVFVNDGIVILRDSQNPKSKISLVAGERASFKAEKLSQIDFKIEWLNDEIKLADRSVLELLTDLKEIFPKSLKFEPSGIDANCRITSKFTNISLLEVVQELELLFELDYESHPGFIHIKSLECE